MRFAEPNLLYLLLLVPTLVGVFIYAERKRKEQLSHMTVNEKPGMVMGAGFERRLAYMVLLSLGTLFLVLAAARPQWGTKLEEAKARGIDILIAVDVSESMSADDVSPNRMARARQQVDKFLNLLEGDRVGLIAFAGSAFTYCPLTLDYGSVRLFLESLEPGIITDPGTDIPAALRESVRIFTRAKTTAQRVLVVFSDGENHEGDFNAAVNEAREAGVTVFTIGIGNPSKSGSRIPIGEKNGEILYKTDKGGHIVFSQLDETTLQAVAQQGGGDYYRISEAGIELSQIYKSLNMAQEAEFSSRRSQTMEDRFQYPLLIALAFLVSAYSLGHRSFKKLRRTQEVHG